MGLVKFNLPFKSLKDDKVYSAEEVIDMTFSRADRIVADIRKQAMTNEDLKAYSEFSYERVNKDKGGE